MLCEAVLFDTKLRFVPLPASVTDRGAGLDYKGLEKVEILPAFSMQFSA